MILTPRRLAKLSVILAGILTGALLGMVSKTKAETQCIPDLKTIQSVIEDIQRIRINGERTEVLLRDIRDSLTTSPKRKR